MAQIRGADAHLMSFLAPIGGLEPLLTGSSDWSALNVPEVWSSHFFVEFVYYFIWKVLLLSHVFSGLFLRWIYIRVSGLVTLQGTK